ncbi:amidohydrolase family protein [Altericroceibacterium spongiae]|nr:amidohydrolase family protein [Altericroceibacterium spongiae]
MEKIIDCHFHLWDLKVNYYPWLTDRISENVTRINGDYRSIRKNYLIEDFRKDMAGVDVVAAVHLQADADPADSVSESAWLQSVADSEGNGMPQGFVARGDLRASDAAETIEQHCAFPNLRGLRAEMHPGLGAPADYNPLKDETWLRNLALLEKHKLVLEVRAASPEQTDDVISLIRAHPNINFVFPHLALSIWRDEEAIAAWKQTIRIYGELPNVYLKLSGYGLFGKEWTIDEVRPYVLDCIDAIGPDRLVCGSNYPVDGLAASYARIWETHSTLLDEAGCNAAERAKIFHDNGKRLYRL